MDEQQLVAVSVNDAIESAVHMVFNEFKYRTRLVKEYGDLPTLFGNKGKLAQVFLNLLLNATHAIEEGDVEHNEIGVRTGVRGEDVVVEIWDTGKGISPEDLGSLFNPFFTTKGVGVGSGLGLTICQNIVTSYGGSIEVESDVGQGSRFVVRLPVKPKEEMEPIAVTPAPEEAGPSVRGRILIIDDEAGIRKAMARMLKQHELIQAASGQEGRQVLEDDHAFDLILCDMMMSKMSGMDLHRWLSSAHPALAERIIFITGGAFTSRTQEYLSKINNIRIKKPFDVAHFKKIVNDHIRLVKASTKTA